MPYTEETQSPFDLLETNYCSTEKFCSETWLWEDISEHF